MFNTIRLYNKFPLLTIVIKQVIFWIVAYGLLGSIIYLSTLSNIIALKSEIQISVILVVFLIIVNGLLHGIILGLMEHFFHKKLIFNYNLGVTILVGGLVYFLIIMGLIGITRLILFHLPGFFPIDTSPTELILKENWNYYYAILLIYTLFMTLVLSFINQMEKKFGLGYLLPILLGRFRYPREEERIFMFLDLASSTTLAEELGHITYSSLIQECFLDISHIVRRYNAEIYQYVGDEIVISWPIEGLINFTSIDFFFAVQELLVNRKDYYFKNFGVVPSFKAGAHIGIVTMVEVGDVKRDIAYHGDTLNVAARLEGLCNELNQPILISAALREKGMLDKKYTTTSFGFKNLKGRGALLEVYGIAR